MNKKEFQPQSDAESTQPAKLSDLPMEEALTLSHFSGLNIHDLNTQQALLLSELIWRKRQRENNNTNNS